MLALTFSTGVTDAIGFIAFGQIFAANMTGNLIVMGIGAIGAAPVAFWGPLCAVLAFAAGATIAGLIQRRRHRGWSGLTTIGLAITASVIAGVAIWEFTGITTGGESRHVIAAAALGFGMGVQTATARRVGVVDVNTVVVTLTMAGFFMESVARLRPSFAMQARRIGAVALMASGAAVGAYLTRFGSGTGLLVVAGIVLLVAGIGHLDNRWRFRPVGRASMVLNTSE